MFVNRYGSGVIMEVRVTFRKQIRSIVMFLAMMLDFP